MRDAGSNVVIVGGGVIGAACADSLSRDGWRVTLIERRRFGSGCSHGNCGLVCPSHVLPLAEPGAIRRTLAALLKRNSPFSIKPRFDWDLWAWLARFARRCNRRDMLAAGHGIQPLLDSSLALYRDLIAREGLECEFQTRGLLFVFQTRKAFEQYARTDQLLRDEFQLPAKRLDAAELTALEPALKPGLAGGWYYGDDAHLRPDRLLAAWRRVLSARGVEIVEECEMTGLRSEGRRVRGVVTPSGTIDVDAVVVATGAWTPLLSRHFGCRIPIQPGKGYSLTMARPARCPAIPLMFLEHKVAVTPMQSAYRLGSTMEFAGYDATINPGRLRLLTAGAQPYLHEPTGTPVQEEWTGWRPMTPDGLPIIDRAPVFDNAYIAAGHNMLGLSMAPATGKLIAELLGNRSPHVDPRPYALSRFHRA